MPMTNREIHRQVSAFKRVRADWLDILVGNPRHSDAALHIVSINSKIELLESFWDFSDETLDFPL